MHPSQPPERRWDDQAETVTDEYARYFFQSIVAVFVLGILTVFTHAVGLHTLRWIFAATEVVAVVAVFYNVYQLDKALLAEPLAPVETEEEDVVLIPATDDPLVLAEVAASKYEPVDTVNGGLGIEFFNGSGRKDVL